MIVERTISLLITKIRPKLRLVTIDPKYANIYITPAKAILNSMLLLELTFPFVDIK
jgi:hypothetical protein